MNERELKLSELRAKLVVAQERAAAISVAIGIVTDKKIDDQTALQMVERILNRRCI